MCLGSHHLCLWQLCDVTKTSNMAVDERSSPQTGDQLRFENTNNTTATDSSSASEGAAASRQSEVCKDVVTADEHEEDGTTLISGPRTGRGRRKQCRPVRVCLRDDDDGGGGGGNNDDVAVNAKAPEVSSLPEAVGLPAQNVCELCGAEETSPEALAAHASTCRGRSYPDADDAAASGRAFPTPYHQLGSELMRGADAALLDAGSDRPPTSTDAATPVDCSLSYTDDHAVTARYHGRTDDLDDESDVPLDFTLHSEQLASSSSSSSSALSSSAGIDVCSGAFSVAATMKHLPEVTSSAAMSVGADAEDFCEFCQKRFCNKYYLRKHRHDVHGVPASDTHPLPQQQQVSNSFLPQDALPLLALTSDALTAHDDFITSSSSLSTSAQQLPFQTPLMTSLQPFVLPFQTSTSTTNSLLFQSPPSAADLATSPADAAGLLPSLTSLMLLNPFASSLALLNSSSFLHQTSPAAAAAAAAYSASSSLNTLAELQKTNAAAAAAVGSGGFGGLCDDVAALSALMNPFLPPPPSDASSGMTVDDPLSSSHHCELCRKEFCSAYFLAVHRREKHGIATSTALSDTIRLLAAGNGRPGGVLESLGAGTEPGEKLPSGGAAGRAGKSHGERTSTLAETSCSSTASEQVSAADQVCGLCKKQFPNRYGLVLHLLSAHNVRPEGFGLAGELLQLDGVGGRPQSAAAASGKGGLGSGLTLGASAASSSGSSTGSSSKQSDRVSCDICNKEVCNKYFLKTHKMKVHGLDAVAAAVYNPPPPPLDSTRSEAARSPASVSSSSRQHQQQQQQHDEMRKALLMADSQFSAFASHLDFALKSAASTDPTGAAGFGVLPPPLQQQQTGEPMMTASDIFRLFGLVGSKQDDPFLSLGPPPPPLSLHSLLSGIDLCSPLTDAAKHTKPVELKIPKHVSHHHKDAVNVGMQQHQQPGRVKHSAGHHNGRHGRDQAGAPPPPPQVGAPRQSQPAATAVGPPSDQELIQSGIDPEAYCELCQKEFCSKYFLRTHRQKIHGVSASKTAAVDVSFDHYRPMTHQAAGANPVLQMFPGLALPTQPMFGSGPTGLLPPAPVVDVSSDPFVVSPQGRAGAKEAANATRVTCDVCGKELCNKYFLRTHMAKIHGCTTGNGSFEPDVGEATSDTSENRVAPDDRAARGSPSYEKWPTASGSLPNSADHWNIPPLPADSIPPPPHRPHSRNYSQETDFPPRDNGEDTASRANASLDPPHSTQVAFAGDEAVEHLIENGERSLPVTRNDRPSKMDEESSSSNLDTEPRSDVAALFDPDISQVRAEKRAVTANDDDDDDDGITKRPRTDCMSDSSTLTGDEVTGNHAADHPETDDHSRSYDSTASSGVIQFVSRSKDSVYHSAENSNEPTEKMQVENCSPGTSTDAGREHPQSANAAKQPVLRSSTGRGDYDGPWFTTVNGHADLPRETAGWQAAVSDGEHHHQQQQPLMQPFIMRQEPLHAPASCDGAGSPGTSSSAAAGDRSETTTTTQFAACQLMLPVIRPIRDQLTVEFSVTPVVSSD